MKLLNKTFTQWLHVIHRDLGYLMVGICIVYGTSGFLLNHMNGKDPSFKTVEATVQFEKGLDAAAIESAWKANSDLPAVKKVLPVDEKHIRLMLDGGIGVYNSNDGKVDYETHKKRVLLYWFNRLHYSRVNGWNVMADIFAVSLIFFAVSGLFMVKGKNGLKGRGKWFLLIGILIPVIYVLLA